MERLHRPDVNGCTGCQAIILRRRDIGEADRLLTVFTRDRGKLNLLAKGVRRAASRKAGHIEPFTYTDLLVAKGANLDLVTQAETIDAHRHVREDLWLSSLAYYVVELADAFTQDEDPNALLFDWSLETLRPAGRGGSRRTWPCAITSCTCWTWPATSRSSSTASSAASPLQPEVNFLSLERGGCLCPKHGANRSGTIAAARRRAEGVALICRRGLGAGAGCNCGRMCLGQVESILARYIVYHLERRLRAPVFWSGCAARLGSRTNAAGPRWRSDAMEIREYQQWLEAWDRARGWDRVSPVAHADPCDGGAGRGRAADAAVGRLQGGRKRGAAARELEEELSDVFVFLFKLAYQTGVDVEAALTPWPGQGGGPLR